MTFNAANFVSLATHSSSPVFDGAYITSSAFTLNGTSNKHLSSVHFMEGVMRDDAVIASKYVQTENLISLASSTLIKLLSMPVPSTTPSQAKHTSTSSIAPTNFPSSIPTSLYAMYRRHQPILIVTPISSTSNAIPVNYISSSVRCSSTAYRIGIRMTFRSHNSS